MKIFNWRVKRRREIEIHARHVGAAATDDLPRWLIAWVWDNPQSRDQVGAVMECARRIGRKGFTAAEARAVIDEAGATPRARKADDLARYLQLDYATRHALGITMIGAYDADKRERRRRRRERDRQAKELKRREKGARLRSEYEAQSISRAKPWEAEGISRKTWYQRQRKPAGPISTSGTKPWEIEGISRRTWYRRRQDQQIDNTIEKQNSVPDNPQHQGDGTGRVTSPGTAVLLKAADTPVTPFVPSKKDLKRGGGDEICNQREGSPGGINSDRWLSPDPSPGEKGGGLMKRRKGSQPPAADGTRPASLRAEANLALLRRLPR